MIRQSAEITVRPTMPNLSISPGGAGILRRLIQFLRRSSLLADYRSRLSPGQLPHQFIANSAAPDAIRTEIFIRSNHVATKTSKNIGFAHRSLIPGPRWDRSPVNCRVKFGISKLGPWGGYPPYMPIHGEW